MSMNDRGRISLRERGQSRKRQDKSTRRHAKDILPNEFEEADRNRKNKNIPTRCYAFEKREELCFLETENIQPLTTLQYYLHNEDDNCVAVSIASALHFMGYVYFAAELIKADRKNRFCYWNNVVSSFGRVCRGFRLEKEIYDWTEHERSEYPIILQTLGSNLRIDHCVTIWKDKLFDGNHRYVMKNTRRNLDWGFQGIDKEVEFMGFIRGYRMTMIPSRRNKRFLREEKRLTALEEDEEMLKNK